MKKDFIKQNFYLSLDSNIINQLGDKIAFMFRDCCHSAKRNDCKTGKVEIDIKFTFME